MRLPITPACNFASGSTAGLTFGVSMWCTGTASFNTLCIETKFFLLVILRLLYCFQLLVFSPKLSFIIPSLSPVSLRRFPYFLARCVYRLFAAEKRCNFTLPYRLFFKLPLRCPLRHTKRCNSLTLPKTRNSFFLHMYWVMSRGLLFNTIYLFVSLLVHLSNFFVGICLGIPID